MVSILQYLNSEIRRLSIKELASCLQRPVEGFLWVDMEDPTEAEDETLLVALLDFHPLAIEDCQRGADPEQHLPKVEDFNEYLFVIFNPIDAVTSSETEREHHRIEIRTAQVSAFLSRTMLLTHHYKPLKAISNATVMCGKNAQVLGRGPDFLFHMIIDDIVDDYTPILDRLDDLIDGMEEEVFGRPTQLTMMRILDLKRTIMTIRRIAMYQREMLNRLSRGEFSLITRDEMFYYRNVYDHLVRMADVADSYRDLVGGLLDAYLSVTSNSLSQVMKVLTIISTIFLPLSVITGYFGMNFRFIPGLEWEHGPLAATVFMMAVAAGMLYYFRRKGWI